MSRTLVAVMAHPDDIEIHIAGTLCLLRERGYDLHFVTVASGDCGSMEHGREEIAAIRAAEARGAAELVGATYDGLGVGDLRVEYSADLKTRVVDVLRRYRAEVVITHARHDYMTDHEMTSVLTREACFAAPMPNWPTASGAPVIDAIPELYYADPTSQTDWRGEMTKAEFVVDISATLKLKSELLACHASQRDWLRRQHGEDNYILSMKHWAQLRGEQVGIALGEGFTQHLGHPFPRRSSLREDLHGLIHP